jgi:hypothetical protein
MSTATTTEEITMKFAGHCCTTDYTDRTEWERHHKTAHKSRTQDGRAPLSAGLRRSEAKVKPSPLTKDEREWLGATVAAGARVGQVWSLADSSLTYAKGAHVWVVFPGQDVRVFPVSTLTKIEADQPELVA